MKQGTATKAGAAGVSGSQTSSDTGNHDQRRTGQIFEEHVSVRQFSTVQPTRQRTQRTPETVPPSGQVVQLKLNLVQPVRLGRSRPHNIQWPARQETVKQLALEASHLGRAANKVNRVVGQKKRLVMNGALGHLQPCLANRERQTTQGYQNSHACVTTQPTDSGPLTDEKKQQPSDKTLFSLSLSQNTKRNSKQKRKNIKTQKTKKQKRKNIKTQKSKKSTKRRHSLSSSSSSSSSLSFSGAGS